ncbi:MAG: hypothetical protein F4Y24_12965 [Gemmatimonadetes bacterium]|nr:hypothetical protein [Gemmatimonadota bacterium]MYG23024.1 hypothetical protein [Gemmatimonadota bacterium]MYJ38308.1 hypothetical protein [Gemmatimonadota bacterium]
MTGAHRSPVAKVAATTILLTTPACDTAPSPTHTIRTDSAGIPIVTAVTPLWGPGDGWTVDPEPLVEIGTVTGAPEYQFSQVVAAVRLSNGDIVVADRGASELRSYDSAGTFRWRTGRFGEGPGEFESLDFLGTTAGDSLVTYDVQLLRAQLFDSDGELGRTIRVALQRSDAARGGSAPDKAVGLANGRLIVRFVEESADYGAGIQRWLNERVVAIRLDDGSATPLIVVPGPEVDVQPREGGGLRGGRYVFAKMPEFGAAADAVAVIGTEAWSVQVLSPVDGTTERIVRREVVPREATDPLVESHLRGILDMALPNDAPAEQVDFVEQMWRGYRNAPTLPVLRSVHVDAAGNLWLAPYYLASAHPPPFEIHAPDGAWLGSVSVPPGLQRAFIQYQAPYMEIGEDYILGVWTDDLDVQYVRMYPINK